MALKPACSLDELPLEEILEDLKVVTLAYRKLKVARERRMSRWYPVDSAQESRRIKRKQRELNRHLLQNVVPVAKGLSYLKIINCEPKEMHFCNLPEKLFGTRSLDLICLNRTYYNNLSVPSTLVHETIHVLGGIGAEEALVMLLGCEIDARLMRAGFLRHKLSLLRNLQAMVFITSYHKSKSLDQLAEWKDFIEELYDGELTREDIEQEMKHLEEQEEGIFHNLSDYAIPPYLSIKGMAMTNTNWVLEEWEYGGKIEKGQVELSTLAQTWKQLAAPRICKIFVSQKEGLMPSLFLKKIAQKHLT